MKPIVPREWMEKNTPNRACCSYYLECNDGAHEHPQDICHARANPGSARFYGRGALESIDQVHTCTPISVKGKSYSSVVTDLKHGIRFHDYIFDKEKSPYRSMLKNIELHKKDDGSYLGVSILDTDVPTALMMNFLIATRMPWEKPHTSTTFFEAVEAGLDEAEAFVLALSTSRDGDGKLTCIRGSGHDVLYGMDWRNPSVKCKHNILNVKNGTPDYKLCDNDAGESYKKLNTGTNWHRMWEGGIRSPFDCNYQNVEMLYYTGKFGKLARTMPDFPLPMEPGPGAGMRLTIEQLKQTRKQWSQLQA